MVVNKGFSIEGDVESSDNSKVDGAYGYEEALDLAGNGKYNILLLLACFLVITAMGIDIFGLGIIVTASTCDLGMTLQQIGILSSMPFAGIIVMSYPWGYLSDTRGRKLVLMCAMCTSFVSAALSSLAPNWQTLAVLRFISSAMSSAAESATYALLGECCGSRVRARYMLLMTSALMLTPTLYYIWAWLIMKLDFAHPFLGLVYRPWRLLTFVMALPLGLGAAALWFFTESPKFLANVGRSQEAVQALRRIYEVNGGKGEEFPVKQVYLEEGNKEEVGVFSLRSLWTQIAPLFKPPLLGRTLLLFYLTFVVYIANNSFAIILPTIFNVFFTSYANSGAGAGFCDLFAMAGQDNSTSVDNVPQSECKNSINDNTIWAGCAHGLSFFILNALISQCAGKRKRHGGVSGHDGGAAERVQRHQHHQQRYDQPLRLRAVRRLRPRAHWSHSCSVPAGRQPAGRLRSFWLQLFGQPTSSILPIYSLVSIREQYRYQWRRVHTIRFPPACLSFHQFSTFATAYEEKESQNRSGFPKNIFDPPPLIGIYMYLYLS